MKKNILTLTTAFLRKNGFLLFSTLAALVLFSAPSKILLLLEACIFAAVLISACVDRNTSRPHQKNNAAIFPGAAFSIIGFAQFVSHAPDSLLRIGLAAGFCAAGFYSFYRLSCRIDRLFCTILCSEEINLSIRNNALLPLSACAFFVLTSCGSFSLNIYCGFLAGTGLVILAASRIPSLVTLARQTSPGLLVYGGASAVGICWAQLDGWPETARSSAFILCLLALPFAAVCICAMTARLLRILKELIGALDKRELFIYGILLLAALVFVAVTYFITDAFYATAHPYDIIYTFDSPSLVKENAYFLPKHLQNDLRQPLFAVFAAPFLGFVYFLSRILSAGPVLHALLLNLPQVVLLLLSHILLANACGFHGSRRMGFVLLLSFAYPSLLFMLALEQYVIAYFYICLSLYAFSLGRADHPAYWGASGTLLTSAVFLPLLSRNNPFREFRAWFRDMVDGGIGLIAAILLFSRGEILLDAVSSFLNLNRFSGASVTFTDKLYQFTVFVSSCITAPKAQVIPNMWDVISWQLTVADGISLAGVLILVLCGFSVILGRRSSITWIGGLWVLFSIGVLLVFGWGTQENGLILYALYFGWAYLLLLYQLADRIFSLAGKAHLTGIFGCCAAVGLAAANLPAIMTLLQFAVTHYPG